MFSPLFMFWFLSIERPPDWKNKMCHYLFFLISFRVPIKALSYFHMSRFMHLRWQTYAPSPHLQSLEFVTILVLRYSLMMRWKKLMFKIFWTLFAFDCIALIFNEVTTFPFYFSSYDNNSLSHFTGI